MRLSTLLALIAGAFLLTSVARSNPPQPVRECGPKPSEPSPRPDCTVREARCVCDRSGQKCSWIWICWGDTSPAIP